ncbi:hypothetical protein B0H21DRAFT_702599 [Amylocystis lapponica]|nr:hypothetical protein B0H21DRAFT_702599 [Amylocystis lapponica]
MRVTRSVISGSFALKIVDRQATFLPNDLDIYVPSPAYDTMLSYLTTTEDYVRFAHGDHQSQLIRHGRRIDIIRSVDHSPTTPIPFFWSTLVMNFVMADSICCAYPLLTLNGYALAHVKRMCDPSVGGRGRIPCLEKYTDRGYILSPITQPEWNNGHESLQRPCVQSWVCPRRDRFFGDQGCLLINLACSDNDIPLTHRGHLTYPPTPPFGSTNMWRIGGPACGEDCVGDTQAEVLSTVLVVRSMAGNVHFID